MKIDLLEPARRTYYQSSWRRHPASLSELATEEGLERFRDHRRRFMEAAKLAVEPADADRVASLERLESRLEAVQPVKLVPGQIACQLGSSWVPASVIRDFALETFQIGYGDASRERGSHQTAAQAPSRSATPRCPAGGRRPPAAAWTSRSREEVGRGLLQLLHDPHRRAQRRPHQIEKDNPDYNPAAGKVQEEDPRPGGHGRRQRQAPSSREAPSASGSGRTRAARPCSPTSTTESSTASPRARTAATTSRCRGMSPDIQLRKHQRDAVARIIRTARAR